MSHAKSESAPDNTPRLPSTRPIDHRWDQSRGIVFSNATRPRSTDHTWSRDQGVVFSSRAYASRSLSNPPPPPPPPKPVAKFTPITVSKHAPSMINPNVVKSYGSAEQLAGLEAERNQERQEKEKAQQIVKNLEDEVKRLQEGNSRLERDKIDVRESVLKARANLEREYKTNVEAIRDREINLKQTQDRLRERDRILADAIGRYRDQGEKVAELQEQVSQMASQHTRDMTDQKLSFDQRLGQLRASIEHQQALRGDERSSYDTYRKVFDQVSKLQSELDTRMVEVYGPIHRSTLFLTDKPSYLDRVAKLDPWFKHKYPRMVERITEWISQQQKAAIDTADYLRDHRTERKDMFQVLMERAHQSRTLTRFHHFEQRNSKAATADLYNYFINDRPFRLWRDDVADTMNNLRKELSAADSRSDTTSTAEELSQLQALHATLNAITKFHIRLRDRESMNALLTDSLAEREAFVTTLRLDKMMHDVGGRWIKLAGDHPYSDVRSVVSKEDQNSQRRAFSSHRQETQNKRTEFRLFVKKRAALEASLGLLADKEEELNRIIRNEMQNEKVAMNELTDRLGIGRLTRRERTAFARPAPRATSAPATVRRSPSVDPKPPLIRRTSERPPVRTAAPSGRAPPGVQYKLESELRVLKQRFVKLKPTASPEELQELRLEVEAAESRLFEVRLGRVRERRDQLAKERGDDDRDVRNLSSEVEILDKRLKSELSRSSPRRIRVRQRTRTSRPSGGTLKVEPAGGPESAAGAGLNATAAMSAPYRTSGPEYWCSFRSDEVRSIPDLDSTSTASFTLTDGDDTRAFVRSYSQRDYTWVERASEPTLDLSDRILDPDLDASSSISFSDFSDASGQDVGESEHVNPHATVPHDSPSTSVDAMYKPQTQTSASDQDNTFSDHSVLSTPDFSSSQVEISTMPDTQPVLDPPVTYNISAEDRRAAAFTSRSSNAAFWSYKLYKNKQGNPPMLHYCKNAKAADAALQYLIGEKVLGFDLEWEPRATKTAGIKKNVSLIQIASESKMVLLHIALFPETTAEDLVPESLRTILESAEVLKAGVNISGDARRMREYLGVDMKGVFELSHLYRVVKAAEGQANNVNRKLVSLADQVQTVLLLPLKKDDVRVSAWSKQLNAQQSDYAGSDAYAGFRLFHELEAKRKTLDPRPPRPAYYELFVPLIFADGTEAPFNQYKKAKPVDATTDKAVRINDDGDEDFYDAAESLDAPDFATTSEVARVPLSGIEVSYPTLPADDTPYEDANSSFAAQDLKAQEKGPESDAQPQTETPARRTRGPPPASPEIDLANAWISSQQASQPHVRSSHTLLRAYHMWHEQGLEITQIAALARDPPLQDQTIATYVLQVVRDEDVPFVPARLEKCFQVLPETVHYRFKRVWERL